MKGQDFFHRVTLKSHDEKTIQRLWDGLGSGFLLLYNNRVNAWTCLVVISNFKFSLLLPSIILSDSKK